MSKLRLRDDEQYAESHTVLYCQNLDSYPDWSHTKGWMKSLCYQLKYYVVIDIFFKLIYRLQRNIYCWQFLLLILPQYQILFYFILFYFNVYLFIYLFLISHPFYTHQCIHVNPNLPIQILF